MGEWLMYGTVYTQVNTGALAVEYKPKMVIKSQSWHKYLYYFRIQKWPKVRMIEHMNK